MQSALFKLPLEISYKSLEQIRSVKFTSREIDVVACILSGRAATKNIASFLSIESKTVEVHTRNVRLKLKCNSREGIVQFIEKAGKFSTARHHYLLLLIQFAFEQKLQQISALVIQKKLSCLVLYERQYENFISQLRKYFKHFDVEGVFRLKEGNKSLKESLQEVNSYSFAHYLFVASPLQLEQVLRKESLEETTLSQVFHHPEAITFISLEEQSSHERDEINCTNHIRFGNAERYYLSFFDLFKRLFPEATLDKLMSEFKKQYDILINDPSCQRSLMPAVEEKDLGQKEQFFDHFLINFFKKRIGKLLIGTVFCLSALYTLILAFGDKKSDPPFSLPQLQKRQVIRSDLSLPHDSVLINRPEIMKQIEEKLRGHQGVQTLALTGIGGAGKTIIARQYGRQQESLVWEINAETRSSLRESFEHLADALVKTQEEKEQLRELKEDKNPEEKERNILFFVKERLKTYPNWLLIFDNVEKLADIQKHLLSDLKGPEKGRIIVTTRNSHIESHSWIQQTLNIEELLPEEKLTLFRKILNKGHGQPLPAQKEQMISFLKALPSFPLDISIAAYYLKATNISYDDYIKNLHENKDEFDAVQRNILDETGSYSNTRYKIVTLSLKNIIKESKNFEDLLLFISLISSYNIPKDLLTTYQNSVVVDSFIHHLKKYSLIIHSSSLSSPFSYLSIHQSTQNIALVYLMKELALKKEDPRLQAISNILDHYIDKALEEEDFLKMRLSARHAEKLLGHQTLFSDLALGSIESKLGCLYYFLEDTVKAFKTLEKGINTLNSLNLHSIPYEVYSKIARSFLQMGNIYTELSDYEKAKTLLEKSLHFYTFSRPNTPSDSAWIISHLANVYRRSGYYGKAKQLLEDSINVQKEANPKNYPRIARTLALLGSVYRGLGDYKKARAILEESLQVYKEHFLKDHFRVGWVLSHLGNVYRKLGYYEHSIKYLEESLHVYKKSFSETHINVGLILTYLGNSYKGLGNYQKAKDLLEEGLKIHEKHFKKDHARIARILFHLGAVYREMGNEAQSKLLLQRALLIYENSEKRGDIEMGRLYRNMGGIHEVEGRFEQAEQMYHQSLEILQRHHHPETYVTLENLADLYDKKSKQAAKQGQHQQAQAFKTQAIDQLDQALQTMAGYFPKDSAHVQRITNKMKTIQKGREGSS